MRKREKQDEACWRVLHDVTTRTLYIYLDRMMRQIGTTELFSEENSWMLGTFSPEMQKRTDAIDTSFTVNFSWPSFFLSVYFVLFFTYRSYPLYACFAGFTLFAPLLFRAGELCLVQKKYFLHLCLPLLTIGPPAFPVSQRSLSPLLLLVHSSAPQLCCLPMGGPFVSDLYYSAILLFLFSANLTFSLLSSFSWLLLPSALV